MHREFSHRMTRFEAGVGKQRRRIGPVCVMLAMFQALMSAKRDNNHAVLSRSLVITSTFSTDKKWGSCLSVPPDEARSNY